MRSSSGHPSRPTSFQTKYPQKAAGPSVSSSLANTSSSVSALLVGDAAASPLFASFVFTVEAVKMPPIAVQDSVGVVIGYQLEWSIYYPFSPSPLITTSTAPSTPANAALAAAPPQPIAAGVSPLVFADGDEVHFDYVSPTVSVPLPQHLPTAQQAAAMVRPHRQQQPFRSSSGGSTSSEPVQYPANAFPQLVVNLTARMLDEDSINAAMANSNGYADDNRSSSLLVDTASYSVGTLTLDLASHLPPHGTLQLLQLRNEANNQSHHHTVNMNALKPLKQRATLYLEQCIYQSPPVMIRVLIEGTVLNEKGLYEAEYKGAMLMAGDGMGRGGGVAAVDVGAAENAKLLGKGSQQQQQQRSPSMVSSAPSVSRPIGRVPTPTGRPAMGMLASPFGTSSASTTQHTQEGPHINDDNTNTNNVSASQAIQNGVEMARRRAAQVRAKAREEAERERAEQIKAGGRSGGAPTPAVASTMSSRAHTPIHTSVSLRGSNALNTAPFAAAAANATTARRVVPTNANGTVPPPSSSLPSSSSAPPPPTAPSLYAAPAMRSDTNNNNRGPSQQQQNNANNMTPSRGNISSSPLSHYHATSPQPIPLNGAADGGGSPQPQQHQWGSSSAVAIASPQPSDPTSFKSGAFGSAHHHMANAATASPPRHQQQQVGGGVGGNATLVDVRSPSLSSDIMHALQRSNVMLKEDNERLKQALEQQLSLPQHHHHQRTQMNSILLNDNTTTASALPHDASPLSLFMSPLPHANRNQQQRQHAQQSSEQSMAIIDTIEELASAKAALAHTEGMYAEAVKASREKDHQIEVLQRAKHEAAETEAHLREEVARLETALDVATQAVTRNAAEEKSAVAQLKEQLLDAERTNRDTHHKLRHSEKGLADAKSMLKALEEEVNKEAKARAQAEERAVKVLADCTEKVERYEASLRLGQHELERLHAYGEDLNTRCTELASLVTSQAAMLERRKEKILELRGIIAANEKHLPVGWGTANAAGDLTSSDLVGDAMLGFGAAKNNNNTNKMSSLSANAIQPTNSSVAAAVAPTATNFYTTGNGAGSSIGGPSGAGGASGDSSSVAANASTAMNAVAQANAALQASMARQALTHQRHLMELGAGSPLRELSRMLASQQHQQRQTLHTAPILSTMNNNDSSRHMLMGGAVTPQQQQFGKSNGGGGGGGGGTVLFARGGNTNTTADKDDFTVSRLRPNERASHHYADPNQAVNDASYLEKSPLQIREEGGAPSSLPPPPLPQQHVPAAFNYQQPYAKEGQFIGIQMVPASLATSPLPLPAAVTIPTSVPRSQQRHESSRSQTQVPSPPASSSPYRSSQQRGGAEQSPSTSTAAYAHFYSNASRSPPRPTAVPGPHHHQHIAMVGNNKTATKRFVPVDDPDL